MRSLNLQMSMIGTKQNSFFTHCSLYQDGKTSAVLYFCNENNKKTLLFLMQFLLLEWQPCQFFYCWVLVTLKVVLPLKTRHIKHISSKKPFPAMISLLVEAVVVLNVLSHSILPTQKRCLTPLPQWGKTTNVLPWIIRCLNILQLFLENKWNLP